MLAVWADRGQPWQLTTAQGALAQRVYPESSLVFSMLFGGESEVGTNLLSDVFSVRKWVHISVAPPL
jgi:hypothetical protein